jgi:hypothetical protein
MFVSVFITMIRIFIVAVLMLWVAGCSKYVPPPASNSVARETTSTRINCPVDISGDYYFPEGKLAPTDLHFDEIMRRSTSEVLLAMGEKSVSCGSPGEVYRFLWDRGFDNTVIIRVTKRLDAAVIYVLEFAPKYGEVTKYNVVRSMERTLSPAEFESFVLKFRKFEEIPVWDGNFGIDGSGWIVERSVEFKYQVAFRWSPESGVVREIGSHFMSLTGWDFGEIY